jgi:hypothetical protein
MIGFRRKTVNSVLRLFTFTDSVNVDFEDQVLSLDSLLSYCKSFFLNLRSFSSAGALS